MNSDEPSKEILTDPFCERAADQANKSGIDLIPEEVLEILGGISGLYLDAFLKAGQYEISVPTTRAFVSAYAPELQVLTEIENCSGYEQSQADGILEALEHTLREFFNELEVSTPGKLVRFKPFGRLEVIDLNTSAYLLTYRDPAADLYTRFLLK